MDVGGRMKIIDRSIVITGGTRGIDRALIAGQNAVIANGRDESGLDKGRAAPGRSPQPVPIDKTAPRSFRTQPAEATVSSLRALSTVR